MYRFATSLVIIACMIAATAAIGEQEAPEKQALLEFERNTIELVERYGPSVVAINVVVDGRRVPPATEGDPEGQLPPPLREAPPRQGSGSGFVIDDELRIVTNYHVIQLALREGTVEMRNRARIDVIFPEADQAVSARVAGANALYDLALLELEDTAATQELLAHVEPFQLAAIEEVQVGQKAMAIGNPFGFENSVTVGTVSGLSRSLPGVGQVDIPLIQTDTAINPGNSGGPLINSRGQIIGVNTAIVPGLGVGGQRGFIGLGFAVPSDILEASLPELLEGQLVDIRTRARLGVSAINIDMYPAEVRREMRLPEHGVAIVAVEEGGAAEAAGLQGADFEISVNGQALPAGGDVILEVDGNLITTVGELQSMVFARAEGDSIELLVWREGETFTVEVTLVPVEPVAQ